MAGTILLINTARDSRVASVFINLLYAANKSILLKFKKWQVEKIMSDEQSEKKR